MVRYDACVGVLKVLLDRTRLRIVRALYARPHNVNELAERLHCKQFEVSRGLKWLRGVGIVEFQRFGKVHRYHLVKGIRTQGEREVEEIDLGCCRFRLALMDDEAAIKGSMLPGVATGS